MNFLTKKPGAASAASVVNKVGFWPAKDSLLSGTMEKYHNEEDITKEKSQEEGYQEENSDLRNSRESLKETAHGTLENADDWECKLCQYRTTKKQLILNHYKRVHTNIRDYKCDQCGKEFTQ